ncbi:hypothetical protein UFOVP1544_56 [uncultured Caudovirales phage]|uniref:Uncharacterized protein n=1 Tax=uncultured Caudovirales phage TaxID=2100421 RepID=A0A6J7XGH3_9CAUD|nr:hypothetical protein UFOVP1544_56 [uncultured Caudovirales phage]
MTGFNSKRRMALAKLPDDDDAQVYADTLLIVYQRGFDDGKKAAQRKPLTNEQISAASKGHMTRNGFARAIEAAHNIKEGK